MRNKWWAIEYTHDTNIFLTLQMAHFLLSYMTQREYGSFVPLSKSKLIQKLHNSMYNLQTDMIMRNFTGDKPKDSVSPANKWHIQIQKCWF